MNFKKLVPVIFIVLLFLSTITLGALCLKMNNLLGDTSLTFQSMQIEYNALQKQTSLISIILFVILLLVGFINYYINQKIKYVAWANLLYVPVTLFTYVTLNYNFYKIQGVEPKEASGFWLILFIGIFYIIGAILVTVIGSFTVRNLHKRSN